MKDYLARTFWLTLVVVVILIVLHYLPAVSIGDHPLRRINILADVQRQEVDTLDNAAIDSILPPAAKKHVYIDTCKAGITCIEDYGEDSTHRGMEPFYSALNKGAALGRPVRIAYFGDSFIEADILTADLRSLFQDKFGGCGVGYLDITSQAPGFRPTVRHSFGGWKSHCISDSTYFDRSRQGISNHYFVPTGDAYMEAQGVTKYTAHIDTFLTSSIFFETLGGVTIKPVINGSTSETQHFLGKPELQMMQVKGRIGKIRWNVEQPDSSTFYGITMEAPTGVSIDNFGLRSSSGIKLTTIPMERLKQFGKMHPYDLIVLQYGLNIASNKVSKYDYYQKELLQIVAYLEEAFPEAGILIVGVGDRNYKDEEGQLRTMPGIKYLIRYQQSAAISAGVAFWSLFDAMGGEGSMARLVHSNPPQANLDYTHINFRGGRHIAQLLFDAMVYGKEVHQKREAYEKGK